MKVAVLSLGCKVNTYESEYIIELFKKKGYTISSFNDLCDVYIINTCTVTNNSDAKSRKIINQARRRNKDACIVALGCFVESTKIKKDINADIIIGNYNKSRVVELVEDYLNNKKQIINIEDVMSVPFEDMSISNFEGRTRAFVKIQDGCENYCSYCIIPYVRGRCRSKEKDKVIEEITSLVNNGYKEIVLTGIHTGNYGADLNIKFSSLLEEILNIKGLERLRISSIEITELDDKFFELLKRDNLCNHLHIPLQNGSDKILKLMNRKYNKQEFLNIIKKIRQIRSDISLTTDVIVGFPFEEEVDFLENMEFIKEINFSKIHTFPYSKRDGTKAATMPNQVKEEIKKDRARRLINLSNELEDNYYLSQVGNKQKVLIEKIDDDYAYGHTSNYLYLKLEGDYKQNEIYEVVVTSKMLSLHDECKKTIQS